MDKEKALAMNETSKLWKETKVEPWAGWGQGPSPAPIPLFNTVCHLAVYTKKVKRLYFNI